MVLRTKSGFETSKCKVNSYAHFWANLVHHFRWFCELNLLSKWASGKSIQNASNGELLDWLSTCSSREQIWFAKPLKRMQKSCSCFQEGYMVEFCTKNRGSGNEKMLNLVHRSLERKTCQASLGRKWCSWACMNSFCSDSAKVIILKFLKFSQNDPKWCDFPSVFPKST